MASGDIVFRLPNARAGAAYAQRLEPQPSSGVLGAPGVPGVPGTISAIDAAGVVGAVDTTGAGSALRYLRIGLPPALGMQADTASGTVSGIPQAAGVYDIEVAYRLAGQANSADRRVTFQFIVTPDPRSLWRDLPSDLNAPYWRPDRDCQAVAGDALRLAAASTRGRAHAHAGAFRDDDFRIAYLPDTRWQIAVVADGAGSARYGRRGAQLICELALNHLRNALGGDAGAAIDLAVHADVFANADAVADAGADADADADADAEADAAADAAGATLHQALCTALGQAAVCAVRGIEQEAAARGGEAAQYADFYSTALIAICKRYPGGTLHAAYRVGDGATGVYGKERGVTLLGQPDSGEYGGQTRFLDPAAVNPGALAQRVHHTVTQGATALLLMTDGVSDAWFESDASLARRDSWDVLWRELEPCLAGDPSQAPGKLLAWLDFWSPGNHDDRTIAIIYQES